MSAERETFQELTEHPPIDEDQLMTVWGETVGPDVDLREADTQASYQPTVRFESQQLRAMHFRPTGGDTREDETSPDAPEAEISALMRGVPGTPAGLFGDLVEIGRGGMGVVYKARQHSLDRDIALKRLQTSNFPGQESGMRLQFLAEALANGRLDHPNIVPVYDLCVSPRGELSLAMKLVGGRSWRALLDDPDNDFERNLEILSQVCNAVAFAHSRNIVHNDLKPANVLVGEYGEVLVSDWGLALDISEPRASLRLRHKSDVRSPFGTPGYISPELARGDGAGIGTWTDVYLLGGLLYQLLAGRVPHQGSSLLATVRMAAFGNVPPIDPDWAPELRELLERSLEPRISKRLADVRAFQSGLRAYLRHKESRQLCRRAADRLATCRVQAERHAALSPQQRAELYEDFTAAVAGFEQAYNLWQDNPEARTGERAARRAFAQTALARGDLGLAEAQAARLGDVQAAGLSAEIQAAREQHARERSARRRLRQGLFAAVTLVIVGLIVGLIAGQLATQAIESRNQDLEISRDQIALQLQQLEQQKRLVERERGYAEERSQIALRTLDQLVNEVQRTLSDELADERAHAAAFKILGLAMQGYRDLRQSDALTSQRADLGTAYTRLRLGSLLMDVAGDTEQAQRELVQASQSFAELALEGGELAAAGYAKASARLAYIAAQKGDFGQAVRIYQGLIADTEQRLAAGDDAAGLLLGLSGNLLSLAAMLSELGELERALEHCVRARQLLQALEPEPGLSQAQLIQERCAVLHVYGSTLERLGRLAEARAAFDEQLVLSWQLYDLDAQNPHYVRALSVGLRRVARVAQLQGLLAEALSLRQQALELDRVNHSRQPDNVVLRRQLAITCEELAEVLVEMGQLDKAGQLFGEVLAIQEALIVHDPANAIYRADLSLVLGRLSLLAKEQQHSDSALVLLRRKLALDRGLAADSANLEAVRELSESLLGLGQLLVARGELVEAEAQLAEGLRLARQLAEASPGSASVLRHLTVAIEGVGHLLRKRRDFEGFLTLQQERLAILRALMALDPSNARTEDDLAAALDRLGEASFELGALAEAQQAWDEALQHRRKLAALDATGIESQLELAGAMFQCSEATLVLTGADSAQAQIEEGLELLAGLEVPASNDAALRSVQAAGFDRLGAVCLARNDAAGASEHYRTSLELVAALSAADPDNVHLRRRLLQAWVELSQGLLFQRALEDAADCCLEALAIARSLVEREGPLPQNLGDLALVLYRLADVLHLARASAQARPHIEESLAIYRDLLRQGEPAELEQARALDLLGLVEVAQGRNDRAEACFAEAAGIYAARAADSLRARRGLSQMTFNLAFIAEARGELDEAIRLVGEVVANHRVLLEQAPQFAEELAYYQQILSQLVQARELREPD